MRDNEDTSGSEALCSLLFQAVRSASYTHRRYANYVREVGDPLTRGVHTRDNEDTSGSEALCSLLYQTLLALIMAREDDWNTVEVNAPGALELNVSEEDDGEEDEERGESDE
ncbi:hypothetical protein GCK72_012152 [Caenorhabditis remanei]|uniref:Uncharacterized protein n=1 Tax=Caenorhabditis remanei TaxID=31234 RepID=A0A6A5GMG1_CAERE|nr:hypothetical protein GCK72_012152 [Caenorhabditis remanei]KAF1755702.1 hypothetical protein GCK72_012152 [Caenorhabditis remanei]